MLHCSTHMQFPDRIFQDQVAQQLVVGCNLRLQGLPRLELIEVVVGQQRFAGEENGAEPDKRQETEEGEGEQIGAESSEPVHYVGKSERRHLTVGSGSAAAHDRPRLSERYSAS